MLVKDIADLARCKIITVVDATKTGYLGNNPAYLNTGADPISIKKMFGDMEVVAIDVRKKEELTLCVR